MISNPKELLALIREKPEMYIGFSSVVKLQAFLDGYWFARYEMNGGRNGLSTANESLINGFPDIGFQKMVEERFSIVQSISWAEILTFVSGDERKGLELFWKLWDEYVANQEINSERELSSE